MAIADRAVSYKAWSIPSPKAAFLLVHGLGANPSWWESFGNFFLEHKISSYAVDLRASKSFDDFEEDMLGLHKIIKTLNPGVKIFAVGESMGALLALSASLTDKKLFDGVICMSPAFKSKARLGIKGYIDIFTPLLYNPQKKYRLLLTPDMCTRDTKFVKIIKADYDKDVLSTSKVLFGIFLSQLQARFAKLHFNTPLLFLLAMDDKLVDSNVSKKVFDRIYAKDKAIILYPGMYHSLSIEKEKEKVFKDIADWVLKRI